MDQSRILLLEACQGVKKKVKKKEKKLKAGQTELYLRMSRYPRRGSKPISPNPVSIPIMQIFDLVTLSDIRFILVKQLLLLSSEFPFTNRMVLGHISNRTDLS